MDRRDGLNRRDFIGSLLGTVFSSNFFVRTDSQEWQRIVLPYRCLIHDLKSGLYIQAPGIATIESCNENNLFGFKIKVEPLLVSTHVEVDRSVLLTERGNVISDASFRSTIQANKGDKLIITQDLNVDKKGMTLEEVIDLFVRRKQNGHKVV